MSLPPLYDESDYEALRAEKDARIAELEAEKNLYFTKMQEEFKRAEQAEAELAALKKN